MINVYVNILSITTVVNDLYALTRNIITSEFYSSTNIHCFEVGNDTRPKAPKSCLPCCFLQQ